MKRIHSTRGFTLTEAMMTVAIVGIVSVALGRMMIYVSRFYRQTSARSDIQRNVRTALDVIQRRLSEARGRSIVIDRLDGSQPHYSRLAFTDMDGKSITFYQQGTKLRSTVLSTGATQQTLLAENLRLMTFSYPLSDNAKLISVGLAFEKATYEGGTKSLQLSLEKVRIQNPDAQ